MIESVPFQEWFSGTNVSFSEDVEGNEIENGKLILGMRAYTDVSVDNLLHEMSHFVEIDDDRCGMLGWGLRVARICVMGTWCTNIQTFQACEREIRVHGIQRVLASTANAPFDAREKAELIWDWIPGSCYVFDRFPGTVDPVARITQAILDESNKWDLTLIRVEWDRKCGIFHDNS